MELDSEVVLKSKISLQYLSTRPVSNLESIFQRPDSVIVSTTQTGLFFPSTVARILNVLRCDVVDATKLCLPYRAEFWVGGFPLGVAQGFAQGFAALTLRAEERWPAGAMAAPSTPRPARRVCGS